MKIILKKTNCNFYMCLLNNNKNIFFIKYKKNDFLFFFDKIKKILSFFKKKIFCKNKYNGKFKNIINYINLKNGR